MFKKFNNITYLKNEPLKNHSSFKIGGNARFFVIPHTIDSLLDVLYTCKKHSLPYKIIGNGSNLLFDDLGYGGTIIRYDNSFKQIKNNILYASSGLNLSELMPFTHQYNLGGFEFTIGVPAQLGGAIVNNLGAYNQQISTYIEHVTILQNNQIIYLTKEDCKFGYHSSILQNNQSIVLGATFNLPFQSSAESKLQAFDFFTKRKSSQPLEYPNAGSIFKRTNEIIPARLIDKCGLKGLKINDAQVSTKHTGFIVNIGNAKCKDVLTLIKIIKEKIFEKYAIILDEEIEYIPYK